MNNIVLMGNLVKDIDLKTQKTKEGAEFKTAKFTLAVPREYTTKDGKRPADFIDLIAYDIGAFKLATNLSKYFKKGDKMLIKGRLEISEYVNDKSVKVRKTYVKVEGFDFCQKKNVPPEEYGGITYGEWMDVPQD